MIPEEKIYGWIERSENNLLKGWICHPEEAVALDKTVEIWVSGRIVKTQSIEIKETDRRDLQSIGGVSEFVIDFDTERFANEIASANVFFLIRAGELSGPIKVVAGLVHGCADRAIKAKKGLSFGRESTDKVAVVGAGGNIFLRAGTNNLDRLYIDDSMVDVDKWVGVFNSRMNEASRSGYRYIQMLLPEKSSVLHWMVPYKATRGSPGYQNLVRTVRGDALLSNNFFNGLQVMPDEVNSEAIFRAFDTHMSTVGAKLVVDKFLEAFFGLSSSPYTVTGITHVELPGDVGSRFCVDGMVVERPPLYSGIANGNGEGCHPQLLELHDPEEGNTGTLRHWSCSKAPIKKKVMCFGGSSFERAANSTTLSWWFSRLFSEFHFVWGSEPDPELIEKHSPDIVICQTVERFLTIPPSK